MTSNARNPFSSERLRPGFVPFLFSPDESLELLTDRLRCNRWRGQIVGPHGSGKSTLLQALIPRLLAAGCELAVHTYTGGRLRCTACKVLHRHDVQQRILVIDGFEQLHPVFRIALRLRSQLTGNGLLITTHRPLGLPTIHRARVTSKLAWQVVRQIAPEANNRIQQRDVEAALQTHGGNCRDALFALYDLYELRMRAVAIVSEQQ